MTSCIEYNDWQLRQFTLDGQIQYEAIAAGSTASGALGFGELAWSQARTQPQQFNSRFLTSLNAEPIKGTMSPAKNQADLVYHQLTALPADEAPRLVAVPGYLTDEQLGLLLGIAQQAGIQIGGFIDLALAQAVAEGVDHSCLVLDVELHRLVLTQIQRQDNQLVIQQCDNVEGAGVAQILDGWINLIADIFVHQTRFDPMHTGACEQQLQDQLTGWIKQGRLHNRIAVDHNDVVREIDLQANAVHDKLAQRIDVLSRYLPSGEQPLLVTKRAQAIPGLLDYLQQRGLTCHQALAETAAIGVAALAKAIPADEIVRITSTTVRDGAIPAQNGSAPSVPVAHATHLLYGNTAYIISDAIQ